MNESISISRQCKLLDLSRSTLYYKSSGIDPYNLELMRLIDEQYLVTPFYGSRRITAWLNRKKHLVNRKRIQRLMRIMGIEAIYPKPNLSKAGKGHKIYPYLLRGLEITRVNQVWSADITYIRLKGGFIYLVAIIDWFSRKVLSWNVSITLESDFCVRALEDKKIRISMDGKGRAIENIFIERLWRSFKYEEVYLKEYQTVKEACRNIKKYFILFYYSLLIFFFFCCIIIRDHVARIFMIGSVTRRSLCQIQNRRTSAADYPIRAAAFCASRRPLYGRRHWPCRRR